jgi:hypothetical protein
MYQRQLFAEFVEHCLLNRSSMISSPGIAGAFLLPLLTLAVDGLLI